MGDLFGVTTGTLSLPVTENYTLKIIYSFLDETMTGIS
jgi:hypothetical protein